jgi:hypothetical protein
MAVPHLTDSVERLSAALTVIQLAYAYRAASRGPRVAELEARRRLFAALDDLSDKEVCHDPM